MTFVKHLHQIITYHLNHFQVAGISWVFGHCEDILCNGCCFLLRSFFSWFLRLKHEETLKSSFKGNYNPDEYGENNICTLNRCSECFCNAHRQPDPCYSVYITNWFLICCVNKARLEISKLQKRNMWVKSRSAWREWKTTK